MVKVQAGGLASCVRHVEGVDVDHTLHQANELNINFVSSAAHQQWLGHIVPKYNRRSGFVLSNAIDIEGACS